MFPLGSPALPMARRSFIVGSAALAMAAMLSPRLRGAAVSRPSFRSYPFTLGVASGDPAPDGMVLWTRLAPSPLEIGGGMVPETVIVSWQVAEDEGMTRIVQQGDATATPEWAHSVHVEVAGLRPDRWYWYRFKAGTELSPVGRTRTMPLPGARPERLRFAFASCQKHELGYFTPYDHLVKEDLDLILFLGDYIYEGADDKKAVRPHGTPEIKTLDDYRRRHALYKTDPALQAVHAQAPWIVTWDDHEVDNNYAGALADAADKTPTQEFLLRRAAAYQAYYEHLPLRRSALPSGPDMLIYRRLEFGQLASFHVLDTRQYRTDQPLGDGWQVPVESVLMDPRGTILGEAQRNWLFDGLATSTAGWNVLAQQVFLARIDMQAGPEVRYPMDKWCGYEFERRNLLRHLVDHKVANPVVLTGDVHNNWANELVADYAEPATSNVGVEFVTTSITSRGDGANINDRHDSLLAENPFVKFHNDERGYVRCEVTAKEWRSDYKTVPYVSRPGAPICTRASFVVEFGIPRLQRI